MSEGKLKEVALILEDAIEIKDRKRHLRMFRKSFIAKEAFWWLILNKQCADERGALVLGNQLLEAGFIQNLSRPKKEKSFENNRDMFQFCSKMVPHRFSVLLDPSAVAGTGDEVAAGDGGNAQIPEESEVGAVATTAMYHNPLRTMGGGSISSTTGGGPEGRGRGGSLLLSTDGESALFGVSGESSTDQVAEADVEACVTREMQHGVKSLQQLNANFVRDFGEETFFTWRDLIKQLHFKYAGPVSRLLARIADQGAEIKTLDDTANVNDAKLAWLEGVITVMAAAVKRTMDVAAQWDVPPESYSILAEEKLNAEAVAVAETTKVANAARDVLRDAALIGQRDKRARSEANKEVAAAAVLTASSPIASAIPATAVGPAAARERTSSGLPEMRRRSSAMKSVGSRQSAQKTFAAFKDTQSKSFRKKATDATTDDTAAAAAPTTTAVVKPTRPTRPAKPLTPQEEEKEKKPEELPGWTRPQRMDSGTFQKGGVDPGVALVPHHLSGVFEEVDGEKDA